MRPPSPGWGRKKTSRLPFFSFGKVRAGLVKGTPWLEDLYRFPKTRVKVEFLRPTKTRVKVEFLSPTVGTGSVELSQETLYDLFRKYGKIVEITSQPQDSTILPKFAHNDFVFLHDSIMARSCLHGFTVRETTQKPPSTVTNSIFAPPFPRHGKLSHLNMSSAGL